MVQATYLIVFCWITANDTTVLFINLIGLHLRELKKNGGALAENQQNASR